MMEASGRRLAEAESLTNRSDAPELYYYGAPGEFAEDELDLPPSPMHGKPSFREVAGKNVQQVSTEQLAAPP
jgi:hypothetical protein